MTPKTFLENFRHVINAPLGVSRLREMVYALAMSGSLCPQRAEDGTGHRLLEQIAEGKDSRIQNGVFKRSPKLEGSSAKYSDSLPRIPRSWAWSRLVDLGEINPRNDAADDCLAAFAPMNAISELHNGPIRSEDRKWASIKQGFTHFADGDVMVAKITPCFENGKGAVLRWLTNGIGAGTTELHVVRPLPGVLPEYIYVFLRSPHFKSVGESHMTGTAGQKRLSTEYFALREFPLPPLEEQKRIVAKVDELMRLCDRLEAQQQEREKLLPLLSRANHCRFVTEPTTGSLQAIFHQPGAVFPSELRKSILELAVRGVLVPQMEPADSVEDLLKSIATERQAVGRRESARIPGPSPVDTLRFDIPSTWRWQELDRLLIAGPTNGISPKAAETETPVRSVTLSATTSGRFRGEHTKFISNEVPPDSDLWLEDGDILVQRGNTAEYVGVPAVYHGAPRSYIYPDLMMRIRVARSLDVDFVHLAMSAEPLRNFLRERATGTAGTMPKINHGTLKSLPIPVPPLMEQQRIVARVRHLMAIVDHLEQQLNDKHTTAESFARASVAAITSTAFTENERMKPPKTEVVTALKVGHKPMNAALAPLAALLSVETSLAPPKHGAHADANRELTAKELWQISGLEIDAFYRQLKTEMANGWIDEDKDKRAVMKVEAR